MESRIERYYCLGCAKYEDIDLDDLGPDEPVICGICAGRMTPKSALG